MELMSNGEVHNLKMNNNQFNKLKNMRQKKRKGIQNRRGI